MPIVKTDVHAPIFCFPVNKFNFMEELYNHVFHYNPYEKLWNAIPRDVYLEYWSNRKAEGVLKSKDIDTLIEILSKGEDFIKSHFT